MVNCIELFKYDCANSMATSEVTGYGWLECLLREKGIKNKFLINVVSKSIFIIQFLLVILSLLIIVAKFVDAVFKCCRNSSKEIYSGFSTLFLYFTPLFIQRLNKTDIQGQSLRPFWIIGPNIIGKIDVPQDVDVIDWEDFLQNSDVVRSLKDSIIICWLYLVKYRTILPVYHYFDFCLVARSLERITPEADLYFSNQCDRWGLLFDQLPSKSKTLLQHGIDMDYHNKLVRLKRIDTFYAISKGTWQMSYTHLLECKPELRIMKPTIELTELDTNVFSVLIISHIIYLDFEKEILEAIKDYPIKVFLKKHPTVANDTPYKELQSLYGFTYITDKVFPKVDYVISYESTLVYEYMNYDIPIFTYDPQKCIDIETLKIRLSELIKNFNKNK